MMTSTKIVVDCATGEEQVVPLTAEEQAELDARVPQPMPEPTPSDAARVAALEAQNAALIVDLSKATTLAQVRAAAVKAADLA